MKLESWLIGAVVLVWVALAGFYAFAPGLGMPGYARVWGGGAAIFATLLAISAARRRPR